MNQLKITKATVAMALAMGTLYGCGGSGSDPVATEVPERAANQDITSADMSGQALKGTLTNALVTVAQMNGSPIKITSDSRTDSNGHLSFAVEANPGYGIDSMFKVTVSADDGTSMVCDAINCNGVALGDSVSGAQLAAVKLNTLTYVDVPYASSADSTADANFQANALTTIATALLEKAVAEGKNVGVRELYELALQEYSNITLKALGVFAPGSNVFTGELVSAERYENFVVEQNCEMLPATDENGENIVDADGNPVLEEVCKDVLVDSNTIKLSLANAAFANTVDGETLNIVLDNSINTAQTAVEGDATVLEVLRQRLLTSVSAVPFLDKLGLSAEEIIDLELAFFDEAVSSGPVQEVTTAANLAGATITARNRISDGEAETKAFDGDNQTKWLDHNDWQGAPTAEDPAWIQIQFAQAHAVSSLFITSANDAPARDPENFNLQGSNDGENWLTLAEFIGESFDERFQRKEFRFSNGLEYSFYRLNITKNKGDDTLMQLAEIQLVGPVYTSQDHTVPADALTITARNRISDGEAESKAFDKDPQTKWLDHNDWQGAPTLEDPSWVQLDFPQAVAVDTLAITSANDAPERDPENFTLLGSNDGGNSWTELTSWLGESFDARFQRRLFSVDNSLAYGSYRLNITKNKGDDTLMQLAEIELIGPKEAGANHGMQAGVTITARNRISDGEAETKAFDGDSQTKWLDHNDWQGAPTTEDPSWVQIQLPQAKAVNKLALTSANDAPARDPENFTILGSHDGESWTALNSWVGESFDDRFQRRQFSFGNDLGFSYYRLDITKNKGDDSLMQVAEIELIGPDYVSVDHSSSEGVQITARNRIGDGEAESKAFDNDTQTKWLDHNDWQGAPTVEDPSWVQLDFPSAKVVTSLAITSANDAPARDPENFHLQGSNDGGVTWVELGNWIGESFDQRFQRKLFEMGNGFAFSSYRLNITKNKGDDTLMQVAEIELIGPEL